MGLPADNPHRGGPVASGPSDKFFYLTTAMNDTLPVNTTSATPELPIVLRAIECVATGGTLSIQSYVGGGVIEKTFEVGDIHDLGYVIAVDGIATNTSFVGYR